MRLSRLFGANMGEPGQVVRTPCNEDKLGRDLIPVNADVAIDMTGYPVLAAKVAASQAWQAQDALHNPSAWFVEAVSPDGMKAILSSGTTLYVTDRPGAVTAMSGFTLETYSVIEWAMGRAFIARNSGSLMKLWATNASGLSPVEVISLTTSPTTLQIHRHRIIEDAPRNRVVVAFPMSDTDWRIYHSTNGGNSFVRLGTQDLTGSAGLQYDSFAVDPTNGDLIAIFYGNSGTVGYKMTVTGVRSSFVPFHQDGSANARSRGDRMAFMPDGRFLRSVGLTPVVYQSASFADYQAGNVSVIGALAGIHQLRVAGGWVHASQGIASPDLVEFHSTAVESANSHRLAGAGAVFAATGSRFASYNGLWGGKYLGLKGTGGLYDKIIME